MEAILELDLLEEQAAEQPEEFIIDDDGKADWAVRKIQRIIRERDRRLQAIDAVTRQYQLMGDKILRDAEREILYFSGLLEVYFNSLDETAKKTTKTQSTYWLPSGKLKRKHASVKLEHDDAALMAAYPEFVKQKPSLDWTGLKSRLAVSGGVVIDTQTGKIVSGASVLDVPAVFVVEV